jgi:hypothetical protein
MVVETIVGCTPQLERTPAHSAAAQRLSTSVPRTEHRSTTRFPTSMTTDAIVSIAVANRSSTRQRPRPGCSHSRSTGGHRGPLTTRLAAESPRKSRRAAGVRAHGRCCNPTPGGRFRAWPARVDCGRSPPVAPSPRSGRRFKRGSSRQPMSDACPSGRQVIGSRRRAGSGRAWMTGGAVHGGDRWLVQRQGRSPIVVGEPRWRAR